MMKSLRVVLGLVILLGLLAVAPVSAQQTFKYFSQTGHNVQGQFLQYYESLENPGLVLGYPITEQFFTSDKVLVQYFQRGRLELRDDRVVPTDLGQKTYDAGFELDFKNSMACEEFPQTGYSVCFTFLEFFKANGGVNFFGNPISSFEFKDDAIVQSFENGRMEWRASNPEGQRVVMSDLGTQYFEMAKEDPALLQPVDPLNRTTESEILTLNARAFPWKAVTYSLDNQFIFVVVKDQTGQPVQGVVGTAKVTWTDGSIQTLDVLTGESGISTLTLPVSGQTYGGLVTVEVDVSYDKLRETTTTSFRIWY